MPVTPAVDNDDTWRHNDTTITQFGHNLVTMPDYLPDTLHNIHMGEGLTKWEAVSFISTDSWGKNRSSCRGSVQVSRCCNGGGCSALLGTGQERISISCRSCRCCLCRHNPYPDPMTLCYSRVQIDVMMMITTTAGNLAMVHTFPNLSVLFSGRVHISISLDNTGRGRSWSTDNAPPSDHTGAIHPISSIQPAMILSLNTRGYNQQIFSGSNEIFSWHHDTG